MHKMYLLLFSVPVISIIVIGLYQILDETFKKEFILERRGTQSMDQASGESPKRRYADAVAAEKLRKLENAGAEVETDAPVAQTHGA